MTPDVVHAGDRQQHKRETAGHLADDRIPIAAVDDTAAAIRERLSSKSYALCDPIVVTDSEGRYAGVAKLGGVLKASASTRMAALLDLNWPVVTPETDQEHAAEAATAAGVAVLPVVGEDGRPVGVLSPIVLLQTLAREHREDVDRLVGILRERADAGHALEDPPVRRVARRLPWLLVGLAMSASATALMASFEEILRTNVMIGLFIPALVYLTDAIGTQTEAIAVRGLSLRSKPLLLVLAMEILTGAAIGLALGLIAFVAVWAVFGSFAVGLGVAISLFAAGTLASAIGLLLPWALSLLDIDPAFGSGPVATIVQDALTILVYFLVMTKLLT
jgi:magnesium transporter